MEMSLFFAFLSSVVKHTEQRFSASNTDGWDDFMWGTSCSHMSAGCWFSIQQVIISEVLPPLVLIALLKLESAMTRQLWMKIGGKWVFKILKSFFLMVKPKNRPFIKLTSLLNKGTSAHYKTFYWKVLYCILKRQFLMTLAV